VLASVAVAAVIIARSQRRPNASMVGVQSNEFPRALDLGPQVRAFGIPVVVGGSHVSGCLAMLRPCPCGP
jgi:hypothetical protein